MAATFDKEQIKHIVVLMLENRSLDMVLGHLYSAENPPPNNNTFEGLLTNQQPIPMNYTEPDNGGQGFLPTLTDVMTHPNPDPHEDYHHIYNQLFNPNPPPSSDDVPNTTAVPPMTGFLTDYQDQDPPAPDLPMRVYAPGSLPVLNGLAKNFCVCDNWFSSIPTQTYCNRSYLLAGTSSGYVNNHWGDPKVYFENQSTTMFNMLEDAGVPWRIYYGGPASSCNAWKTQAQLDQFYFPSTPDDPKNRFFSFQQFLKDAGAPEQDGYTGLQSYSFIEPNFLEHDDYGPENDYHPPDSSDPQGYPSNMLNGEVMLNQVYEALFGPDAPHADSTLLIVTFDEHGGTFDHVPPPQTVSPDGIIIPADQPGGSGFNFERLGVRVPGIVISPYVPAGGVCHTQFDHTSVIKTAFERFGITENLLEREAQANSLWEIVTGPKRAMPTFTPRPAPPWNPGIGADDTLSDIQRCMLGSVAQKLNFTPEEKAKVAKINTKGEAAKFLDLAVKLSGR